MTAARKILRVSLVTAAMAKTTCDGKDNQISRLQSPLMLLQACNDPDLKATAEVH
jgi:hypothetical protein